VRIGQVLTSSTGGIGRHAASVVGRLVRLGHQVRVCCPPETARTHGLDGSGADVFPLTAIGRLGTADVIHAHGYKAGALAVPVARLRGTPLVVSWHNAVLGSGRQAVVGRMLQRLLARTADVTLGASSDLVAEARRYGARDARLGPVAAPVLPPAGPRPASREQLGLGPADIMIITVSRLAPQKNLGAVLDIARLVRDHLELHFFIVGEGPLRTELEAQVVVDRSQVRLLGHREDVASLLAAADIALLTSTWEARALVAQEALLAGVPLVSTRVGGIEELVGDAGVLVAPGDTAAAARELLALAADPDRRAELAALGHGRAAAWPDEDQVVEDLLALYGELSGAAAGHSSPGRIER
jgi:glycosyltransferase involved in cell wall biosynthesis